MDMTYSQRLSFLYALIFNEQRQAAGEAPSTSLEDYPVLDAATYLACYMTFRAIQQAERSPGDERIENFDMLSVYQMYAMLVYTYLTLPLGEEGIAPDFDAAAITIAKSLFSELAAEELVEIVESGSRKYQLIGDAQQEHWADYREDLDKTVIAFVVAGTDDNAPFARHDIEPLLGALLSMLCEAFAG